MENSDYVLIVNHGPAPISAMYAGKRYLLKRALHDRDGTFVPYFAAKMWFGDSRLRDIGDDMDKRYRTDEAGRISVRYGMLDAPFYAMEGERTADTKAGDTNVQDKPYESLEALKKDLYEPAPEVAEMYTHRHPNLPKVMGWAQDESGQFVRWYFITDDPYGDADMTLVAKRESDSTLTEMKALIALQSEQLAKTQAMLAEVLAHNNVASVPAPPSTPAPAPTVETIDPLSPEVAHLFESATPLAEDALEMPDINEDVASFDANEFEAQPNVVPSATPSVTPAPSPNPATST